VFTVYVFCLVLGGGLAALSVASDVLDFGGADFDLDLDLDLDLDVDVDTGGGIDSAGSAWGKLFSIYGILYFILGFGLTGTLLTWLMSNSFAATLPLAIGSGLVSGTFASRLVGYLKGSESGALEGDESWDGHTGQILLPLGVDSPGKVKMFKGAREHVIRALPHGNAWEELAENSALIPAIEAWKQVMVVEVKNGIAYVVPTDEDGSPLA
jgi:hypothetical protein